MIKTTLENSMFIYLFMASIKNAFTSCQNSCFVVPFTCLEGDQKQRARRRLHRRKANACHSTGRQVTAASMPFFLTAQRADFKICVLLWRMKSFWFFVPHFREIHWHTAGQETLVRSIMLIYTWLPNCLPVRLTMRCFHGTLRFLIMTFPILTA